MDPRSISVPTNAMAPPPPSLQEVTFRQLNENLNAFNYDLEYCTRQLSESRDLTPAETRTLQLRVFDLRHHMRHTRHRMETLQMEMRGAVPTGSLASSHPQFPPFPPPFPGGNINDLNGGQADENGGGGVSQPRAKGGKRSAKANGAAPKRQRVERVESEEQEQPHGPVNALQRLGFWKCRLCTSPRYLAAGEERQPNQPCKWPLRDVAKLITHLLDLHSEHSSEEKCMELGDALSMNRGPFEYWLRRSHSVKLDDANIVDQCIGSLRMGKMPPVIRQMSRAAANFQEW